MAITRTLLDEQIKLIDDKINLLSGKGSLSDEDIKNIEKLRKQREYLTNGKPNAYEDYLSDSLKNSKGFLDSAGSLAAAGINFNVSTAKGLYDIGKTWGSNFLSNISEEGRNAFNDVYIDNEADKFAKALKDKTEYLRQQIKDNPNAYRSVDSMLPDELQELNHQTDSTTYIKELYDELQENKDKHLRMLIDHGFSYDEAVDRIKKYEQKLIKKGRIFSESQSNIALNSAFLKNLMREADYKAFEDAGWAKNPALFGYGVVNGIGNLGTGFERALEAGNVFLGYDERAQDLRDFYKQWEDKVEDFAPVHSLPKNAGIASKLAVSLGENLPSMLATSAIANSSLGRLGKLLPKSVANKTLNNAILKVKKGSGFGSNASNRAIGDTLEKIKAGTIGEETLKSFNLTKNELAALKGELTPNSLTLNTISDSYSEYAKALRTEADILASSANRSAVNALRSSALANEFKAIVPKSIPTAFQMSFREVFDASCDYDENGNRIIPKHVLPSMLLSLAHAAIEIGSGVDPTDLKFFSGKTVKQAFETGFDEAKEEVGQSGVTLANKIVTEELDNPKNKTLADKLTSAADRLLNAEFDAERALEDTTESGLIGGFSGLVYGGSGSAYNRANQYAKAIDNFGYLDDLASLRDFKSYKKFSALTDEELQKQPEILAQHQQDAENKLAEVKNMLSKSNSVEEQQELAKQKDELEKELVMLPETIKAVNVALQERASQKENEAKFNELQAREFEEAEKLAELYRENGVDVNEPVRPTGGAEKPAFKNSPVDRIVSKVYDKLQKAGIKLRIFDTAEQANKALGTDYAENMEGVTDKNGDIVLIRSKLNSETNARYVLGHEITHRYLRNFLGETKYKALVDKIHDSIYSEKPNPFQNMFYEILEAYSIKDENGNIKFLPQYDPNTESGQYALVEEILSRLAEKALFRPSGMKGFMKNILSGVIYDVKRGLNAFSKEDYKDLTVNDVLHILRKEISSAEKGLNKGEFKGFYSGELYDKERKEQERIQQEYEQYLQEEADQELGGQNKKRALETRAEQEREQEHLKRKQEYSDLFNSEEYVNNYENKINTKEEIEKQAERIEKGKREYYEETNRQETDKARGYNLQAKLSDKELNSATNELNKKLKNISKRFESGDFQLLSKKEVEKLVSENDPEDLNSPLSKYIFGLQEALLLGEDKISDLENEILTKAYDELPDEAKNAVDEYFNSLNYSPNPNKYHVTLSDSKKVGNSFSPRVEFPENPEKDAQRYDEQRNQEYGQMRQAKNEKQKKSLTSKLASALNSVRANKENRLTKEYSDVFNEEDLKNRENERNYNSSRYETFEEDENSLNEKIEDEIAEDKYNRINQSLDSIDSILEQKDSERSVELERQKAELLSDLTPLELLRELRNAKNSKNKDSLRLLQKMWNDLPQKTRQQAIKDSKNNHVEARYSISDPTSLYNALKSSKDDTELKELSRQWQKLPLAVRQKAIKESKKKHIGARYSIVTDDNGEKYVNVDIDQELFDGLPVTEQVKVARKIINDRFKGKVIGIKPDNAFVNGDSVSEFTYPAKRLDSEMRSDKMRSSTELDNLLLASKYLRHDDDTGHHPEAVSGWDIYSTKFKVGDNVYTGEIKIKINKRGRLFYDVTKLIKIKSNNKKAFNNQGSMENSKPSLKASTNNSNNNSQVSQEDLKEDPNSQVRYSLVTDKKLLDTLNKGETVRSMRSMQVIGKGIYPPMSAFNGENKTLVENTDFGTWYQSDERPEQIKYYDKDGVGKIDLNKFRSRGEEGALTSLSDVDYAPYWHMTNSPLNDQFSTAYKRPELLTVECEFPKSELTSGYKAKGARNAVGATDWHKGPVSAQLGKIGKPRIVYLSRWCKVNRIIPNAEAAKMIAEQLKDTGIGMPLNTVTPDMFKELYKLGVKFYIPPKLTTKDFIEYKDNLIKQGYEFHQELVPKDEKDKSNSKKTEKKQSPKARYSFAERLDVEYAEALRNKDKRKQQELVNKVCSEAVKNGIVPILALGDYKAFGDDTISKLSRQVKDPEKYPNAVKYAAKMLAQKFKENMFPKNTVIVPAPNHHGVATDMLVLANEIAKINGFKVADILGGKDRDMSNRAFKNKFGRSQTVNDIGLYLKDESAIYPDDVNYIILDNVINSGTTAKACFDALGKEKCRVVCIGLTQNKVTVPELKLADRVTYDEKAPRVKSDDSLFSRIFRPDGEFLYDPENDAIAIPLSRRFDKTKYKPETTVDGVTRKTPDVRYSVPNLYTGTAADYEQPSLKYIGTGEGAQVYGWGLYATDNKEIAKWYAENDVNRKSDKRIDYSKPLFKFDGIDFYPSKDSFFDDTDIEAKVSDYLSKKYNKDNEALESSLYDILSSLSYITPFSNFNLSKKLKNRLNYMIEYLEDDLQRDEYDSDRIFDPDEAQEALTELRQIAKNPENLFEFTQEAIKPVKHNIYTQTFWANKENHNLLSWNEPVGKNNVDLIKESLLDYVNEASKGKNKTANANLGFGDINFSQYIKSNFNSQAYSKTGSETYHQISAFMNMLKIAGLIDEKNSAKAASEFLDSIGIDGIKYPSNSYGRGDGSKGWNYVTFSDRDIKVTGHERYSLAVNTDPSKVTNDEVIDLLENARHGEYHNGTYIPVRARTPQILIDKAKENLNIDVPNLPMIMNVGKARQAMEEKSKSDTKNKAHGLDPYIISEILNKLDNPDYTFYQKDNQYFSEIVSVMDKDNKKIHAIIDIKNIKTKNQLNGYKDGIYNVVVTLFDRNNKDIESYLNNKNNILLDKKGVSGLHSDNHVPSFSTDTPLENKIPQSQEKSNQNSKSRYSLSDDLKTKLIDDKHPLKQYQLEIAKKYGIKLTDNLNPYQDIMTKQGRLQHNLDDFKKTYWEPITKALALAKIPLEDFGIYAYAKHAPERNDYIKKIDPKNNNGSGWDSSRMGGTPEQIADELEKKYGNNLVNTHKLLNRLTEALLGTKLFYGLVDPESYKKICATYKDYVPLISEEDNLNLSNDMGDYMKGVAHATGRHDMADNPMTHLLRDIDSTFRNGENNLILNKVAALAFQDSTNPNGLIRYTKTVNKQQYEINRDPVTGKVTKRVVNIQQPEDGLKIPFRFYGTPYSLTINDEDLYHALMMGKDNELKGLPKELMKAYHAWFGITKALMTGAYPEFAVENLLRDNQTASQYFLMKDEKYQGGTFFEFLKNTFDVLPAVIRNEFGKTDKTNENDIYLEEMLKNGGHSGYAETIRLENLQQTIENEVEETMKKLDYKGSDFSYNLKNHPIKSLIACLTTLSNITEMTTRLAAYKNARTNGSTARQAANFSKNITVNFDRQGSISRNFLGLGFNNIWMFSNAAIQSNYNSLKWTYDALKNPKTRNKALGIMATVFATGFALPFINASLGGDDDEDGMTKYDKVPDYIKNSHLVIVDPRKKSKYFLKYPIAPQLQFLFYSGRIFGDYFRGRTKTLGKAISDIVAETSQTYNPFGNDNRGILYSAVPTIVKPIADAQMFNSKWTGEKIKPYSEDSGVPNFKNYNVKKTSNALASLCKLLSNISGGSDNKGGLIDISPATIQHIAEYYSGGVGKFANNLYKTANTLTGRQEFDIDNIPFARRHIGELDDNAILSEYNGYREQANEVEAEKKNHNSEWLKKNQKQVRLANMFNYFDKRIRNLRYSNKPNKEAEIMRFRKEFLKKAGSIK